MSKLETSKMVLILFFGGISIKFCKFFNTNTHYHFLYDLQLMATENKSMLGDKTRKELKKLVMLKKISEFAVIIQGDKINN